MTDMNAHASCRSGSRGVGSVSNQNEEGSSSAEERRERGRELAKEIWRSCQDRRKAGSRSAEGLLSAQQEIELAARIKAGDMAARHQLATANLRLVVHVAQGYTRSSIHHDDLIQEGNLGLLRAVDCFDPVAHPVRFATYATYWIRAYMHRAMGKSSSLVQYPEYARLLRARYLKLMRAVTGVDEGEPCQELLEAMSVEEAAVRLGVSTSQLERIRAPLLEQVAWDDLDMLVDTHAPESERLLIDEEMREVLGQALATLSPRESWVIRNRYRLDQGHELGFSGRPWRGKKGRGVGKRGQAGSRGRRRRAESERRPRAYDRLAEECGLRPQDVRQIEQAALVKLRAVLDPTGEETPPPPPPKPRRRGRRRKTRKPRSATA